MSTKSLAEAHAQLKEHERRLGNHDGEFVSVKLTQKEDMDSVREEQKRTANRLQPIYAFIFGILMFLLGKSNLLF